MTGRRIVQVCADPGVAAGATKGASQHLRGVAAGLREIGHSVVTVTRRRPEGRFPVAVEPLELLADPAALGPVDVVYERCSLGHLGGLELARRTGARFVLEVNAPLVEEAARHRPGTVGPDAVAVEDRLLAEADLVVAVSSVLADWVRSRGRDADAVVLPNGFEPSWFPDRVSSPTHDLVFVGHPKPWHGADRLPLVLRALEERHGRRATLLVVGGGPGAEHLLAAARVIGVDDRITVTGALDPWDASALVGSARVGVAPYPRHERFYFCPLKVVDYLAAGLPIVATDQGDVARLVGPGGVVVDPDDDLAFVDAVAALLADPAHAASLGRRGRRRAFASMSWARVAERTVAAIDALPIRTGAV